MKRLLFLLSLLGTLGCTERSSEEKSPCPDIKGFFSGAGAQNLLCGVTFEKIKQLGLQRNKLDILPEMRWGDTLNAMYGNDKIKEFANVYSNDSLAVVKLCMITNNPIEADCPMWYQKESSDTYCFSMSFFARGGDLTFFNSVNHSESSRFHKYCLSKCLLSKEGAYLGMLHVNRFGNDEYMGLRYSKGRYFKFDLDSLGYRKLLRHEDVLSYKNRRQIQLDTSELGFDRVKILPFHATPEKQLFTNYRPFYYIFGYSTFCMNCLE